MTVEGDAHALKDRLGSKGQDRWNDPPRSRVLVVVDVVIALVLLIVLDIAAWKWGFDSRVGLDDERSVKHPPRRWI